MKSLFRDLRFAVRMLRARAGFTLLVIGMLALAVGANTALFSFADAILFRPLPFADPDRLVLINDPSGALIDMDFDRPERFMRWEQPVESFEYVAAYDAGRANLSDEYVPERIQVTRVTTDFFPMLGVGPLLGRWFGEDEQRQGGNRVVVLSHQVWQGRYGRDPAILNRIIHLNGHGFNVIGVMPPGFRFSHSGDNSDAWIPLTPDDHVIVKDIYFNEVSGKLKPGVSLTSAQAEMNVINERLKLGIQYLDPDRKFSRDSRITLTPLQEKFTGELRRPLLILLGAVGFVLLIACANAASLLLTRAVARSKELAIRAALGAARWRLIRLWLSESLLLAGAGGLLGLLVAVWMIDALVAISPVQVSPINQIEVNGRVVAFCVLVTLLTGLLFGIAPALQSSKPDLVRALKEGGRRGAAGLSPRLRQVLTVGEVAMALILLVGAGLLIKSFRSLIEIDPGFNPDKVLTFELAPTLLKYPDSSRRAAYYQAVIDGIRAVPGVASVGAINHLPVAAKVGGMMLLVGVEGRSGDPGGKAAGFYRIVSADYFRAMEIPLLAGRHFTDGDRAGTSDVVIINQSLARQIFQNENPVGKRISIHTDKATLYEVIGVTGDVRAYRLEADPQPEFYFHSPQQPAGFVSLAIRTTVDPAGLSGAIRNAVLEVDKDQPIYNLKTMEQHLSDSVARRRFPMLILTAFAVVALLLSALGLYGVMSYTVTRRTHEIGVRMALGAQKGDVLRLVVRQGMLLTMIGVAVGLVAAFALTRVMASLLYGVSATDPLTFTGVAALLTFVALLACYVPARRATKVDPMVALRYE